MYAMPDRTAATLMEKIQACITSGSIVISDIGGGVMPDSVGKKSVFEGELGWSGLGTVILFIHCWSENLAKIKFCSEELSISHTTAADWKKFLREACAWRLLKTPTAIGGPGLHVEIDRTLISRRKTTQGASFPSSGFVEGSAGKPKR
ncbi:hypothetical protein T265_04651 [Opisthorchis viverrini]|uniref:Uncharacterized protein n=1 Tax=Opisthorchis viverrini TaxID=6198 RepID=A0A074ZRQ6_OPIVI|nr:hypothetical protein T265_04651 [Opisthorchis viverrini]KER28512.1 hypothetical protein T265_04651 [Opisthorchis viverrini]